VNASVPARAGRCTRTSAPRGGAGLAASPAAPGAPRPGDGGRAGVIPAPRDATRGPSRG
jgi:hypothetical protein